MVSFDQEDEEDGGRSSNAETKENRMLIRLIISWILFVAMVLCIYFRCVKMEGGAVVTMSLD